MRARLIVAVAILVIAGLVGGSILWRRASARAIAEGQAIWIARSWKAGMTIEETCGAASTASGKPIDASEWSEGDGEGIARGPIVRGAQVCVRSDRSIYWDDIRQRDPGNQR